MTVVNRPVDGTMVPIAVPSIAPPETEIALADWVARPPSPRLARAPAAVAAPVPPPATESA